MQESKPQSQIISQYKNSKDGDIISDGLMLIFGHRNKEYLCQMNKYSAAFVREKGAEFYKATPLLFFTFMFVTKIVVLIEFREHNNKKSPDPTSKAQLRN